MLLLLVPAFADSAGDQKSAAQPASDIPKGYEKLFGELADLMKKYPGAAERFHILDTKGTPTPTKGTPTPKAGSFHACCEWSCSSRPCTCVRQCPE
jgi:hypothetical protein